MKENTSSDQLPSGVRVDQEGQVWRDAEFALFDHSPALSAESEARLRALAEKEEQRERQELRELDRTNPTLARELREYRSSGPVAPGAVRHYTYGGAVMAVSLSYRGTMDGGTPSNPMRVGKKKR